MKRTVLLGLTIVIFVGGMSYFTYEAVDFHSFLIRTKDYVKVEGLYVKKMATTTKDKYRLSYKYNVGAQEYSIQTDYTTWIVPKKGSKRIIKYKQGNPENAVLTGCNEMVITMGRSTLIMLMSIVIFRLIEIKQQGSKRGIFKKIKGFFVSCFCFALGVVFYYILGKTIDSFFLGKVFQNYYLYGFIPIIGAVIAFYIFFVSCFSFSENHIKEGHFFQRINYHLVLMEELLKEKIKVIYAKFILYREVVIVFILILNLIPFFSKSNSLLKQFQFSIFLLVLIFLLVMAIFNIIHYLLSYSNNPSLNKAQTIFMVAFTKVLKVVMVVFFFYIIYYSISREKPLLLIAVIPFFVEGFKQLIKRIKNRNQL